MGLLYLPGNVQFILICDASCRAGNHLNSRIRGVIVLHHNKNRTERRNSRFFFIFYNLLTAPRTVSNTYDQVARAQSCANHVQHIGRVQHALCHVAQRDSSAVKLDTVEIVFILALFY